MLRIPAAPSRIPPAKCGRFHSLRYRIEMVEKDLGTLSQTLLRKLLRKFSKNFQNFNPIGFLILFLRCTNFRCIRLLCYEFRLLLLPDRNGRKLHLNRAERPVCRSVSGECNILMVADRKGKPQRKAIFAMFAQRTEGFPLGGRKLQAVCRVSD